MHILLKLDSYYRLSYGQLKYIIVYIYEYIFYNDPYNAKVHIYIYIQCIFVIKKKFILFRSYIELM